MIAKKYESPAAFKRALEDRLKAASSSGVGFARRRQLLVFDRFLARMTVAFGDAVMLKGGLVLELRLERARTTKDVDLRIATSSDDHLTRLQAAGHLDLGDFMMFKVAPDPRLAVPYRARSRRSRPGTSSLLPGSRRRGCASFRSRRTWPRSSTPTPCRASGRTLA